MALEYCRDIENEIGREQVTVIRKSPPKECATAAVVSAEKEKGKWVNAPCQEKNFIQN